MTHCAHPSDIALVVSFHAMVVHFDSSKCDVLVEMAAPKAARATKTNGSAGTPTPRLGRGTNGLVCDGVLVSHVPTSRQLSFAACRRCAQTRASREMHGMRTCPAVMVWFDKWIWIRKRCGHAPSSRCTRPGAHMPRVVGLARQPWL